MSDTGKRLLEDTDTWLGPIGEELYAHLVSTSASHLFLRVQDVVWDTLELEERTDVTVEMLEGARSKIRAVRSRNPNSTTRRAAAAILDFLDGGVKVCTVRFI